MEFGHPVFIALLVFLGSNVLSGIISPYSKGVGIALRENLRLLLPFVLYRALDDVDKQKLLNVFFCFLILISLYGIVQYFTGADWFRLPENQNPTPYKHPYFALYGTTNVFHAKGNFSHHLTFGGALLLSFPLFASFSFCRTLPKKSRWIYGIGTVIILLAIIASLARSVWLGSTIALFILCFRLPKKWLFPLACLGVGMLGGLLWQYAVKTPALDEPVSGIAAIQQRLASGFVLKYNEDRILLWESAWDAIQDYPWLGIGLKNDGEVMPQYREPLSKRTGHQFYNSANAGVHNIYLQTWVNLGIIGLLSYLSIWFLFFRSSIRSLHSQSPPIGYNKSLIWGVKAGITGFLIAGIFENNFRDAEVQTLLMMVLALSLYAMRTNIDEETTDAEKTIEMRIQRIQWSHQHEK